MFRPRISSSSGRRCSKTESAAIKATLLVSDIHISATRPRAVAVFLAFLEVHARRAGALYILGDLFDQWLGDDDETPPYPRILAGLADLTSAGIYVGVLHGNHDFLLRDGFTARTGCELLPDPVVVDLHGRPTLLMHGDSLCTGDEEYQAFRTYSRDPDNQRRFLELPFSERIATADALRLESQAAVPLKSDEIMDVNGAAVAAVMREHGVWDLIHGHTHRPGVHDLVVDGRPARRTVLGDWYEGDHLLVHDAGGFEMGAIDEVAPRLKRGN